MNRTEIQCAFTWKSVPLSKYVKGCACGAENILSSQGWATRVLPDAAALHVAPVFPEYWLGLMGVRCPAAAGGPQVPPAILN